MSYRQLRREIGFGLGTLLGIVVFALGISMLILFLSVGLRVEEGTYLGGGLRQLLLYGGLAVTVGGMLARLYRSRLPVGDRASRYLGTGVFCAGALAVVVALARQTTRSAPFLTNATDKFVLLGITVGFLVAGVALVRGSAKFVGW